MQNVFLFRSQMPEDEFKTTFNAMHEALMADELFHHFFERYFLNEMFRRTIPVIRHTKLDVKYTLQHDNKLEPVKFELVGDVDIYNKILQAILGDMYPIAE